MEISITRFEGNCDCFFFCSQLFDFYEEVSVMGFFFKLFLSVGRGSRFSDVYMRKNLFSDNKVFLRHVDECWVL